MGTLNTAEHYRKSHLIGSITPGRLADVLLVRNLDEFPPEMVISGGEIVAEHGSLTTSIPVPNFPAADRESIRIHPSVRPERLVLPAPPGSSSARVRVIQVNDQDAALNKADEAVLPVAEGQVQPDVAQDVLKFCVVERYNRNGNVAAAFARGFGLRRGAIATSVSVPSNNIVAVGASDAEIWFAIQQVARMQGGYVVVAGEQVLAEVRLPVRGIISEAPFEDVVAAIECAERVAGEELGCALPNPLRALTATVLPTLPAYGMTDRGLIDVAASGFVPVVMATVGGAR